MEFPENVIRLSRMIRIARPEGERGEGWNRAAKIARVYRAERVRVRTNIFMDSKISPRIPSGLIDLDPPFRGVFYIERNNE